MKTINNMIKPESDLLNALNNSEEINIENVKNNAYGIIFPTKLEYGLSRVAKFDGIIKVEDFDLIKKFSFGKYLVQGIKFEHILHSDSVKGEKIYTNRKFKEASFYKKIFSEGQLFDQAMHNIMEDLSKSPKRQVEYGLLNKNHKGFHIKSFEDKDAFNSVLLSPKDKVTILY